MEKPSHETHPAKDYQDDTKRGDSVKYMQEVDAWFDELFKRSDGEMDCDYWKRTRNGVKKRFGEEDGLRVVQF